MKATLEDGVLTLWQLTNTEYTMFRDLTGMKWNRSKQALAGPATLENLDALAEYGRLPSHIEAERVALKTRQVRIDAQRSAENPVPLTKYPVKAKLFKHQIRAANMALITFGWR